VDNRFASAGEIDGGAVGSWFSNRSPLSRAKRLAVYPPPLEEVNPSATFFPIRRPIAIRTSSKSDKSSVLITVG
jgi:hypothetical protein